MTPRRLRCTRCGCKRSLHAEGCLHHSKCKTAQSDRHAFSTYKRQTRGQKMAADYERKRNSEPLHAE